MTETGGIRRTVTRREPIVVEVPSTKQTFEAVPLFWRDRNDLGVEIAKQYTTATNGDQAIQMVKNADGVDVLQWNFVEVDYDKLLHMAYPAVKNGAFGKLGWDEMVEVLLVALEVNGLQRFGYMVDPAKKDALSMLTDRAAERDDGPKMPSSTDASLSEPTPTPAD